MKIEFEDIWKRRVVVTPKNKFEKIIFQLQLWYLKRIRKVVTKIYYHENI